MPSTRAASGISRSQPQVDGGFDPLPEDEAGLLSTIGSTAASGLSGAANFLDLITGASSIRDVIGLAGTGNWEKYNPFDQFLSPFTSEDRTYAREDLLPDLGLMRPNQETGITGWWDDPGEGIRDIGGYLTDVALDPIGLSLGGLGTFKRWARVAACFPRLVPRIFRSHVLTGLGPRSEKQRQKGLLRVRRVRNSLR